MPRYYEGGASSHSESLKYMDVFKRSPGNVS